MRLHGCARFKRGSSYGIATLAILLSVGPAVGAQSAPRPRAILIVGTDYALAAPDTVNAGPIAFQFENRGAKQHEIAVVLARPGTAAAQIVAAAQAGLPAPKLAEAYSDGAPLGALFVAPGGLSQAVLVSSLKRGRNYVVVCTLRDAPTMPQHAALGMFHVIHVR
ncbi:hypothetical protein BH11GEM2_BH11GEM2_40020 [soil metagenome]